MTEKRANEILRTKYPEATIYRRDSFGGTKHSCLAVIFKPKGVEQKVYDYRGSNYKQVLEKLGFDILYKYEADNLKREKSTILSNLEQGGEEDIAGWLLKEHEDKFKKYTAMDVQNLHLRLKEIDEILSTSYIEN